MIEIKTIILLSLIHFLADFGLQTHEQAVNKGHSNKWLAYHVGVYSIIWFVYISASTMSVTSGGLFSIIMFGAHFSTDYITSRLGKPFWEAKDLHNGFVVVGFDQLLHLIQLILTYQFVTYINL